MDYRATSRGNLDTKRRRRSVAEILLRREVGEKESLAERSNSELHKIWEYFVNGSVSFPSVRNYFNAHFTKTKPASDEISDSTASFKIWRRKKHSQPALICKKQTEEHKRLEVDKIDPNNRWKEWGPYLSERQWGTVREDYSEDGNCWDYFPHDHARSRAYRWGEDGLLGITDRECRLCFGLALWNEKDPILKERLFGLTGNEGNHGEDVKECYYYLDSTPTHSYMKALYKYPQNEYPYERLVSENRKRTKQDQEFELTDTGVFEERRYWDIFAEYSKNTPNDVLIKITVANRGPDTARVHVLPTFWFRNTWSWGCDHEACTCDSKPERCMRKPKLIQIAPGVVECHHESLGRYIFTVDSDQEGLTPELIFTENETNFEKLYNTANASSYTKDAFHRYLIDCKTDAVNPLKKGTKMAAHYVLTVPSEEQHIIRCRLLACSDKVPLPFNEKDFNEVFTRRKYEADEFYKTVIPESLSDDEVTVSRQAYAGLLWSKQFYYYVIDEWLKGDPSMPCPPHDRLQGRNSDWKYLHNKDVISMPDKWEYPWYASWDLAFHMLPFCKVDPEFAKDQLLLFLRETYMAPNGQIPAYEFALSDVNPPVHALACYRVYELTGRTGEKDTVFLAKCFQKLLLNFTWWVNRKDPEGKNIFGGGFLGLDNIGLFDRSKPLPPGDRLCQADGTAWMALYSVVMLNISLELALNDAAYEDMAAKFLEHFTSIADAINQMSDGFGLWDREDGFYYDHFHRGDEFFPLRVRSMVGLVPLLACWVLDGKYLDKLPGFRSRLNWFMENRKDLASQIAYLNPNDNSYLLAIPSREQLRSLLWYMLNEDEFLSPYGIRSVSRYHEKHPYELNLDGNKYKVDYVPGESNTYMFGGNSNWRGPIWFCVNYLIVEALKRYDYFYGTSFKVECPTGSGNLMRLRDVAMELSRRLVSVFLPDKLGHRPCHGKEERYATDEDWNHLVLFYEYFEPETGRGCGASHQTGWTALVAPLFDKIAVDRNRNAIRSLKTL
ncbi:uncharacterized protein LOC144647063 [Oculina patagonica]